ncbi:class I adenylate-forming enzyme family protein [Gottfriedia acidiceleris]|uniref:class I adenylate-forming enzyme family protein n=1 Tax=Gottfriedia acidiceleris TaxID=371036 RepID=UPI00101D63F4|nr:long-chain-fatty-acid--CoA ligase [Gottfriedia acidiceleris]
MNIGSSIGRNARIIPDKVAIYSQDKTYTFDQLNRIVNRLAHGLISLGIKKGDKICLMMKNTEYFPIAMFAASKIGAVTVPINIRLTKAEVAYIVDHSDARLIIYDIEFGDLVELARSSKVVHCISVQQATVNGHLSFDFVLTENEKEPDVVVEQHDDSHILYTSGTTGKPKGALFDHYGAVMLAFNSLGLKGENIEHCVIQFMPFYHGGGFSSLYKSLFLGQTIVIQQIFNPVEVLKAIEKYKVSYMLAVPTMYNMILQVPNIEQYDISSLKTLVYGGASMPSELLRLCMERFNSAQFVNRCGLTEGGPNGIVLFPEDHKEKFGTSGKARFLMEARVVDLEGKDIEPGGIGELILRGDMVMKGYYRNPEATAEALRNGWLYTGDMCTIDEDKFITLVDRKKDMIISGGANVYSIEVENVLYSFEGVHEAAVIGLPDENWGETVSAIIVPKPGYVIETEKLIEFCRKHLAGYKLPRKIFFMDELPRNATGKILKYKLREDHLKKTSSHLIN